MTITWNSDADAKLIVALVTANSSTIDWNAVAELMGEGCTVSALKHRLARLKDRVSLADAGNSSAATPKKGKRATPTKATPSKSRAKKADTAMDELKSSKAEMNDTYNNMENIKQIGSDGEGEVPGFDEEC